MLAVIGMAKSPSDINERIADAFAYHLIHIDPERDLPEDLRPVLAEIRAALTTKAGQHGEGGAMSSARALSEEQAVEVARRIVDLYDRVCVANDE